MIGTRTRRIHHEGTVGLCYVTAVLEHRFGAAFGWFRNAGGNARRLEGGVGTVAAGPSRLAGDSVENVPAGGPEGGARREETDHPLGLPRRPHGRALLSVRRRRP